MKSPGRLRFVSTPGTVEEVRPPCRQPRLTALACRDIRNYVLVMREPEQPAYDDHGRQIGTVQRVALGRSKVEFWHARALDGANLGTDKDRDDACSAIRLDWSLGRPRNPHTHTHERYRPLHAGLDAGIAPAYLGR